MTMVYSAHPPVKVDVVTYQSPLGVTLNVCQRCEAGFKRIGWWPKDVTGQEFCSVSHGLHRDWCSFCDGRGNQIPAPDPEGKAA
jgi:hypothetical protein